MKLNTLILIGIVFTPQKTFPLGNYRLYTTIITVYSFCVRLKTCLIESVYMYQCYFKLLINGGENIEIVMFHRKKYNPDVTFVLKKTVGRFLVTYLLHPHTFVSPN